MSATRVMATCATLGQAAGTAAAIALQNSLSPRQVFERRISELKQTLMDDDSYLPWNTRQVPEISKKARISATSGDPRVLVNGIDRPVGRNDNGISLPLGGNIEFTFERPIPLKRLRLTLDSDLNNKYLMPSSYPLDREPRSVPGFMAKAFRIEANVNGVWKTVAIEKNNYHRLVRIPLAVSASSVRFVLEQTWETRPPIFLPAMLNRAVLSICI